jgi:hypothetical protein
MSDFIDLPTAKTHLRVINTAEDTLIGLLIDAAEDNVSMLLDRPLDGSDLTVVETTTDPITLIVTANTPLVLKPSLEAAALLILGDLYENREAQAVGTKMQLTSNPTVERLINPYRKMGV